jgi:hypothetical protein
MPRLWSFCIIFLRNSGEEEVLYFAEEILFKSELTRKILTIRKTTPMADVDDDDDEI